MEHPAIIFGSVCSGIEAASVAWNPLGWHAAWVSEIEPFPCAALAHHYPDVPNLGDMTTLPERIASGEVEAPELFTGGTPCQAFSVAGKRASLADARGNLSLTFCEIADAIDAARLVRNEPECIVVWENVPGVLSTNDNAFGCFLAQLCGGDEPLVAPDGWTDAGCVSGPRRTAAWRVLDAQYFGLAQRRRRVFVVASARNGFDPGAVLFEFDGVRRDSAPRREAGEGTAGDAGEGAAVSGGAGSDVVGAVVARAGRNGGASNADLDAGHVLAFGGNDTRGPIDTSTALGAHVQRQDFESETFIAHTMRGQGFDASEHGTGSGTPLAPVPIQNATRGKDQNGLGIGGDVMFTLDQGSQHGVAIAFGGQMSTPQVDIELSQTLQAKNPQAVAHPIAFSSKDHGADAGEIAPTLRAMGHDGSPANGGGQVAVAFDTYNQVETGDVTQTLCSRGDSPGGNAHLVPATMQGMAVRRLTPVECERLQGFEDNYTLIPWRGKPAELCPDGPRYKALGNSWAVPVVRWIGWRIQQQLDAAKAAA